MRRSVFDTVGYHNMGHHNLGIKIPPKTQNTIRQPGQRSHPGAVPSSMLARSILCRPKAHGVQCHHLCLDVQILSRFQKAQYALGPRPNSRVRLDRGLASRRAISTSPEASPPRPPAARRISASPEGKRLTLGEHENSPTRPSPPARPRCEGKLRLVRGPLGRLGL